jgi:outer membrane protein TolC
VRLATDRYLYGLASYYEVLEAQQHLFPAQNTQAGMRLNRLLAYVQLCAGRGLERQGSGDAADGMLGEPRAACAATRC